MILVFKILKIFSMIKISKSPVYFILKLIMVLMAAGIGLYTGFAKSNSKLVVSANHAQLEFSKPIKSIELKLFHSSNTTIIT